MLSATARRGKHGSMLVDVAVPGSGRLAAAATAAVPITTRRRVRVPVRGRAATRGRTRVVTRTVTAIARRTVARAAGRSRTPGVVRLRLTPASRYRPLAGSRTGLDATIAVTFSASGETSPDDAAAGALRRRQENLSEKTDEEIGTMTLLPPSPRVAAALAAGTVAALALPSAAGAASWQFAPALAPPPPPAPRRPRSPSRSGASATSASGAATAAC